MAKAKADSIESIEARMARKVSRRKPRQIDRMPQHARDYFADTHRKWKSGVLGTVRAHVIEALLEYVSEVEGTFPAKIDLSPAALRNYLDGDKP